MGTWGSEFRALGVGLCQRFWRTLCGGQQDFVVGINSNQFLTVGRETVQYTSNRNASLIELAVRDLAFGDSGSSRYILMPEETSAFDSKLTEPMSAAAASILACDDFDLYYLEGQAPPANYAPYWWNTAPGLGFSEQSTCAEMKLRYQVQISFICFFFFWHAY